MTGPDAGGRVPWIWDWFDDSPRGETYGVRREHEVLCYTDRTKQGFEDAVRIALAVNAAERESCPRQHTWPKGHRRTSSRGVTGTPTSWPKRSGSGIGRQGSDLGRAS